ncbi:MAG: SDR family oxidoreductase [Planctomycetaceae bacterium]|nr:SDR family oxidoreductase [Planctomycetaceae bacterium]
MLSRKNQPVALVTGAGRRRIGNVVARWLAQEGYAVALHYHSSRAAAEETVAEVEAGGGSAACFQADVSREAEVERLFDEHMNRFGRLDALVTTAAIWEPCGLEETTADDVRRHFEINALGTFLCCRRGGLIMASQEQGGAIVAIGDWASVRPYRGYAAYFVSKGAIPTMTRDLAVELAARNPAVRVNAVLPGPVMLPEDLSEDERRRVVAATLLKREGTPESVARTVLFLLQNDYVTGVCIPVDGGRTIAGGEGDRSTSLRETPR